MPVVGRPTRQRTVTNENDENAQFHTARLTRAKAAADGAAGDVLKKPLQTKKAPLGGTTTGAAQTRKRAALGDMSNLAKVDTAAIKDGKKATTGKVTASKATQPSKVQKPGRANSTRSVLGAKDKNAAAELKRPASGSGIGGHVSKKRNTSSHSSTTSKTIVEVDDEVVGENGAPQDRKINTKVQVEEQVEVESKGVKAQSEKTALVEDVEYQDEFDGEIQDLDYEDMDDPLRVAEYVGEIFEYLKELEIATLPNADYMDNQKFLDWSMRGILIDWLVEVHIRFQLLPETLFLAVNIIDRFLSCKVVQLDRLQLVGITAMLIACKYEEVIPPHISSFRHVADDGFTDEEILNAERFILGALNYDLSYPNPMNFLRRVSKADNLDIHSRTFGKYLLEIACLDHRFMKHPPSLVSAAAIYMARLVFSRGPWDATLAYYAGYSEEELQPVFELMVDYLRSPIIHDAFFKKYASKKYFKASMILRQWAKKHHHLYIGSTVPSDSKKAHLQ